MNKLTRRQAIGGLTGVALATTTTSPAATAAPAPAEGAPLVFGPLSIDGWFLRVVKKPRLGGLVEPLTNPKREDVAKALAGCRLYVLDRRTGPPGPDGRFAEDEYPKVAVEGKLTGEWRDGGTRHTLHVSEVAVAGTDTAYNQKPPIRTVNLIAVTIDLYWTDGQNSSYCNCAFSSERRPLIYDITGTVRAK